MSFAVNAEVFEDIRWANMKEVFVKSIIGGYSPALRKKLTPWRHPYFPGLYAKDIIEVTPLELLPSQDGKATANYNLCKVTINFESLPYPVGLPVTGSDDYNRNWITITSQQTSNRISIPTGWYEFMAPSTYAGFPATFGAWFTMPLSTIVMTVYHVTRDQVFGIGNRFAVTPIWSEYHGKVNDAPWAGVPKAQLLFDSSEIQPWRDCLGNQLYNVRWNFIRNFWGWNHSITPGGSIDPIKYVVNGPGVPPTPIRPFIEFSVAAAMNGINPRVA